MKRDNFATLKDIRVAFDHKSDNIVLTSTDDRVAEDFLLTVKRGSPVDITLRSLLVDEGVQKREDVIPAYSVVGRIFENTSKPYLIIGAEESGKMQFVSEIAGEAERRGFGFFYFYADTGAEFVQNVDAAEAFYREMARLRKRFVLITDYTRLAGMHHHGALASPHSIADYKMRYHSSINGYHADQITVNISNEAGDPYSEPVVFGSTGGIDIDKLAVVLGASTTKVGKMLRLLERGEYIVREGRELAVGRVAAEFLDNK